MGDGWSVQVLKSSKVPHMVDVDTGFLCCVILVDFSAVCNKDLRPVGLGMTFSAG